MSTRIHRLTLSLLFPAGIAPGDGGDFNSLAIAKNGKGEPVLRGTALAGAIRHAWRRHLERHGLNADEVKRQVENLFGFALDGELATHGQESRLVVPDSVLRVGQSGVSPKTHHLRNRHTRVVADGGLFSLDACPPGTTATLTLWLQDDAEPAADSVNFLQRLVGWLDSGMTLGGKSARGIGLVRLASPAIHHCHDLANLTEHAMFLDEHRAWRMNHSHEFPGTNLTAASDDASSLKIAVSLVIPRGQDLLVGDGQGLDFEIEPQRVTAADGQEYWRLPGASLRGLFRSWMTRLAAREGKPIADDAVRHLRARAVNGDAADQFNGDNLGWCFLPQDQRKQGVAKTNCPIASLFGSLIQAGRIHIGDSLARCSAKKNDRFPEEQMRMHVAVDRITGGAAESMLFRNSVLTAQPNGRSPQFDVAIRITDPTADEVRWLAKTLRALHVGVLRVGSSKSSGRLAVQGEPMPDGLQKDVFTST